MADAPVSESVQVRAIEMFENERYSPLSGWSLKGLLPTDRNAFTTCDGRDGFNKLEEATEAFISLGMKLPYLTNMQISLTPTTYSHLRRLILGEGWNLED